jgi:elongation factor P
VVLRLAASQVMRAPSALHPLIKLETPEFSCADACVRRARLVLSRHSALIFPQGAFRMAIPATQMRPGMIIKHNNDLHLVFSVEHRTPGNLRAFIQAKLRNIRTGAMFVERFRSPDPIERVIVDEIPMEFLYNDDDDYYFMNMENYEQTHLKHDTLGDAVEYLIPNLQIKVSFHDGVAVGIELPQTVELTVVETEPGLVVQVPPFINEGEKIRVDTAEGAYLSRA